MKTGFENKLEDKSPSYSSSSWECKQPHYDQRSSNFVNVGTHHGVGYNQPVGSKEHKAAYAVPCGRVKTLRVDEKG